MVTNCRSKSPKPFEKWVEFRHPSRREHLSQQSRAEPFSGSTFSTFIPQFAYKIKVDCQPNIIYMKLCKYIHTLKKMYLVYLKRQVSFPLYAEKGPDATWLTITTKLVVLNLI